jgi:hypothetical protein
VLPSQENTHENTLPDTDVLEADGARRAQEASNSPGLFLDDIFGMRFSSLMYTNMAANIENTDENTHKDSRERLKECLEEFDGGEGFNKHLFTSTAQKMLLPLVEACQNNDKKQDSRFASVMFLSTVNVAEVLRHE